MQVWYPAQIEQKEYGKVSITRLPSMTLALLPQQLKLEDKIITNTLQVIVLIMNSLIAL